MSMQHDSLCHFEVQQKLNNISKDNHQRISISATMTLHLGMIEVFDSECIWREREELLGLSKRWSLVNGSIGFFACTNPFSAYKVSLLAFSQGKFKKVEKFGRC